ncbi:MAG TPA: glycine cleavage system protein GcvH [Thermomicrobiaceae bacterium]|nr:glycine cleavage system protein GcvH [Thermomicrobiaceae bacterium]
MPNIPSDLRYSQTHEWVRVNGDVAEIGMDDYAQEQLGDITYLELPEQGAEVAQGEPLGVVESVKAASDIYSPVSGAVVESNQEAVNAPDAVNTHPYETWLLRVRMSDASQLDNLMDAGAYEKFLDEQGG